MLGGGPGGGDVGEAGEEGGARAGGEGGEGGAEGVVAGVEAGAVLRVGRVEPAAVAEEPIAGGSENTHDCLIYSEAALIHA